MPCSDAGDTSREDEERDRKRADSAAKRHKSIEAMLCGITTVLSHGINVSRTTVTLSDVLESVDWTEVGLTQLDFANWWDEHQAKDAARYRREAVVRKADVAKAKERKLAKDALAKLTPAERKALKL